MTPPPRGSGRRPLPATAAELIDQTAAIAAMRLLSAGSRRRALAEARTVQEAYPHVLFALSDSGRTVRDILPGNTLPLCDLLARGLVSSAADARALAEQIDDLPVAEAED